MGLSLFIPIGLGPQRHFLVILYLLIDATKIILCLDTGHATMQCPWAEPREALPEVSLLWWEFKPMT